jgi:hypothetical protein
VFDDLPRLTLIALLLPSDACTGVGSRRRRSGSLDPGHRRDIATHLLIARLHTPLLTPLLLDLFPLPLAVAVASSTPFFRNLFSPSLHT